MRTKKKEKQYLDKRRKLALELLEEGKPAREVAELIGVTIRSIYRWQEHQKKTPKKSERPPGRPSRMTNEQLQQLEQELLRGAYAHGYAEDYWTLERIGHVIWELFGIRYVPSGVWHVMDRMGWSSQKVQRLAIQRDEEAIVSWKRKVWPRIKKVA
jgi:transposase